VINVSDKRILVENKEMKLKVHVCRRALYIAVSQRSGSVIKLYRACTSSGVLIV